ncbi:hypothetical protein CEE45_13120 [Candidatus Heimdallarchaeota archaeon B3_Heim]|nr:MAG: hypothetical protein CEE45_13120 [Candidatus Heimdallarchaeota archaeon B3_Heim]
MTIFEEAESLWKTYVAHKKWFSTVLGETWYVRYPVDSIGTEEAKTYKRSLFLGDDSVHAWEATGVRNKIIQRLIDSSEWKIRPWYGDLGFFADQIRFLPPVPENELDFVVRKSLLAEDYFSSRDRFKDTRIGLLSFLDPEITEKPEQSSFIYDLNRPEDIAKKYSKCQIELYGLLSIIITKLYILSDEEVSEVIDFLFDYDTADKLLVRRFIKPNRDDNRPFIGEQNPHTKLKPNFLLRYIAGEDPEYFPYRIFHLWLRLLLAFDAKAVTVLEDMKIDVVEEFPDIETMKSALLFSTRLNQFNTVKDNFRAKLRSEYAQQRNYSGYMSEFIHILQSQRELFTEKPNSTVLSMLDLTKYQSQFLCRELGDVMIESVLKNLGKQIPEPEGVSKIQSRLILNRRINNLEKYVLTKEVEAEVINIIINLHTHLGSEAEEQAIEDAFKITYDTLVPRGEVYFNELEKEVKEAQAETGGMDVRKELMETTDTPQNLAKQYGNKALNLVDDEASVADIYSSILALKSTELAFGGGNISILQQRKITQSFIELFKEEFRFLGLLTKTSVDGAQEE